MKINFRFRDLDVTPPQFLNPQYYLNDSEKVIFSKDDNTVTGEIKNIERINLFVGANNSGKSRFLRGIFNSDKVFTECYLNDSISTLIENLKNHDLFSYVPQEMADDLLYQKIRPDFQHFLNAIIVKNNENNFYQHLVNYDIKKNIFLTFIETKSKYESTIKKGKLKLLIDDFFCKVIAFEKAIVYSIGNQERQKVYIPILRSLLQCNDLNNNQLLNIAKTYCEVRTEGLFEVLTGLEMYDSVDRLHNSNKIRDLRKFCSFLSVNFFDSLPVDLVPDRENGRILSFSINNEEIRGINKLGDGLQALILILYPIYTAKSKTWFFIEEPETNLHPGLQRLFMETLINNEYLKDKKLRFFFTTHSNHFLDLTLNSEEMCVYQFEKLEENIHRIKTNVKPNKEVLDILGVNTSSVFLANSSIWVEGPTDRKYLAKFLKLYSEYISKTPLKEDIDFAFFEYGGSLLAHYIFEEAVNYFEDEIKSYIKAFSLSNNIYLLADEDNAIGKKAIRSAELYRISSEVENFSYQNTKVKEIENLLPKKTIKAFMTKIVIEEEVSAIDFKKSDYNNLGLGNFYEEQFKKHGILKKNQRAFVAESGTLKNDYKIKLCDFFINSDIKYAEIIQDNPILKQIIEDLYDFIKK